MEYYAIDRIEENYAVCEKDGETMVNISRALLPDGAGEGNVLRRLPDGSFVLDREEEERRRKAAPSRLKALRHPSPKSRSPSQRSCWCLPQFR